MTDNLYIEELLYRGRAPGDPRPSAWHVTIGQHIATGNDGVQQIVPARQYSMSAAIERGLDLSVLLETARVQVASELEVAVAQVASLTDKLATMTSQRNDAMATAADIEEKLKEAQAQLDILASELKRMSSEQTCPA